MNKDPSRSGFREWEKKDPSRQGGFEKGGFEKGREGIKTPDEKKK